jgi:hypothetical protein
MGINLMERTISDIVKEIKEWDGPDTIREFEDSYMSTTPETMDEMANTEAFVSLW